MEKLKLSCLSPLILGIYCSVNKYLAEVYFRLYNPYSLFIKILKSSINFSVNLHPFFLYGKAIIYFWAGVLEEKLLKILFPCIDSVIATYYCYSVGWFSCSVVSNYLWPHESQHARPPCPSPTPRVHSDSHPLSQWCHPVISSSVISFSSCHQSLPASESFPMSQLFTWGGQSTRVSALASFLPKKSQGWSPS